MALLYGMFCTWVVVLRKLAASKHSRLKSNYEKANETFGAIEQECKNDEVAMGRPGGYASQLRLMKQFETVESARQRWIVAQRKLDQRQRWSARLKSWKGRKIPYTFGWLDMALILKLVDAGREADRFDLLNFHELVQVFFK